MKITILQENLAKALAHITKAVSNRPNIPVLANVLLETDRSKLKLSATNLDIGISTWIGCETQIEGKTTVSAKLLFEFVQTLKSGRIELTLDEHKLKVNSMDNKAEFFVIPADDFPTIPAIEGDSLIELPSQDFAKTITKTAVASATDESRPVLTGLLFSVSDKELTLVGVDGFRLAKKTLKLKKKVTASIEEIIPAKALIEVAKLINDISADDDTLKIYLLKGKNQMLFKFCEIELSTRLIEGKFPDYEKILPKDKNVECKLNKDDFENLLKVVNIFARNVVGNKAKFAIDTDNKKIILSATVAEVGNNQSSIDLIEVVGDDFETGFNVRFLSDMVNTLESKTIIFETNGPTSPGVFLDSKDDDFIHVIMPMRLE